MAIVLWTLRLRQELHGSGCVPATVHHGTRNATRRMPRLCTDDPRLQSEVRDMPAYGIQLCMPTRTAPLAPCAAASTISPSACPPRNVHAARRALSADTGSGEPAAPPCAAGTHLNVSGLCLNPKYANCPKTAPLHGLHFVVSTALLQWRFAHDGAQTCTQSSDCTRQSAASLP